MGYTISEIGFPPDYHGTTDELRERSFTLPMVEITPLEYEMNMSMLGSWKFIKSHNAWSKYKNICSKFGIDLTGNSKLKVYTLNEGSISDGMSNSYGSSFLGSALGVYGNSMIPEMLRLNNINASNTKDFLTNFFSNKATSKNPAFKELGNLMRSTKDMIGNNSLIKNAMSGDFINGLTGLALGLKMDIPNIWQGSSSNMSYSFTVRLYNPSPYDDDMYRKNILAPLKALYILSSPRSLDGIFYNRPFGVRINCPGMYSIKEGVITSLSIVKGGDQNDFHYNQRPMSVDIRMSVDSIYPTMSLKVDESSSVGEGEISIAAQVSTKQKAPDSFNHNIDDNNPNSGPPTVNEYFENLSDSYNYMDDIKNNLNREKITNIINQVMSKQLDQPRIDPNKSNDYNDLKNRMG